jgi:hypothetical protein|tara:strand:- start:65 stop:166 length:102 start_codon:yes stop_codon:yes gene_type:complete
MKLIINTIFISKPPPSENLTGNGEGGDFIGENG